MKYIIISCLLVALLYSLNRSGQVGEKVSSVKILDMNNDTVSLPMLGENYLLIFYVDPGRHRQNKAFRNYFRANPIDSPNIDSYGVINLAAAPMIPNSLIRHRAIKEVKGTQGQIYFDPNQVLGTAWKLTGSNNNFAVIFVNKKKIIEFYKAGELTPEDQQKVLALIKKAKED